MTGLFEGRVVRSRVSRGSKSDHEAVMLEVGGERFVLRRLDGNAFSDPVLEALVGHRIRGRGDRDGQTLILHDLVDLGREE